MQWLSKSCKNACSVSGHESCVTDHPRAGVSYRAMKLQTGDDSFLFTYRRDDSEFWDLYNNICLFKGFSAV